MLYVSTVKPVYFICLFVMKNVPLFTALSPLCSISIFFPFGSFHDFIFLFCFQKFECDWVSLCFSFIYSSLAFLNSMILRTVFFDFGKTIIHCLFKYSFCFIFSLFLFFFLTSVPQILERLVSRHRSWALSSICYLLYVFILLCFAVEIRIVLFTVSFFCCVLSANLPADILVYSCDVQKGGRY